MGAWTEIVDFTFTANETSRAFTGLNITKDDFIKIVFTHVNSTSNNNDVSLFANTATTATNYHRQFLFGAGSSVVADRSNVAAFLFTRPSQTSVAVSFLKISENDRLNYFTNYNSEIGSSLENVFNYGTSSGATFTSGITSLTFTSNRTDGIGTGSRIQIYRLDAEKVADITVTSNSTQVDIPVTGSLDPAINKDSEYLLVGYHERGTSDQYLQLFVNDNTTPSNYYSQIIVGNVGAAAARYNFPMIVDSLTTSQPNLFYCHIKLSEIGAFTAQNYAIRKTDNTSPQVYNAFVSSTAENITSITKLNLASNSTNGIGSGSRFILYKLK
jgi:hypothetical protein